MPASTLIRPDAAAAGTPLRIAMVTETWPPEVNGVATTLARVVDGLRGRGHRVQLVRPRQSVDGGANLGPSGDAVLVRGLPIPRYPHLRMGLPAGGRLADLWRAAPPDVVHVATEGPLGWSALRAAQLLGLPVVSDFRTNFHAYSRHYGVGLLKRPILGYLRGFHNGCALTMVPTEPLAAELADQGFERVAVVARGVDTQRFDPARRTEALRRAWGAGPDTTVLLCVGRLAPEKNLGLLLEAHAALRSAGVDLKLVLVGDGPQRAALQAACPEALFAGARHGDDLAAHYASADVFGFPSMTETFGNVVPEAMASGLAVVAYDMAAAGRWIRNGLNGRVVPVDAAERFRVALADVVGRSGEAQRLGVAARETALAHGWARIVAQVEGHYQSCLAANTAANQAVPSGPMAPASAP